MAIQWAVAVLWAALAAGARGGNIPGQLQNAAGEPLPNVVTTVNLAG